MTIRDLIPWNRGRDVAVHRGERANPLLTLHREMNRVFDDVFRGFDMAPFGSDRLFDRALGWQRVGPHQHRLIRFPREVLEFRQIGFKEGRATRRDHDNDAVDRGGAGDQPRELRVTELLHALRGGIDWILRRA